MASFQERLLALQRDWRAQLPQRLQEMRNQLAACRAAPQDDESLRLLHRMLHTLAGGAGSFGEPELGRQARTIEHGLDGLLAAPARQPRDFEPLQQALDDLAGRAGG